ncbi:hypothetical protein, partial [Aeromonas sp. HMWF036]|uniref:hypothetical protein n=1 Tax=Aeromonas sp. HMWF036 TaxID=2056869 RepID=UPI0015E8112C
SKFNKKATLPIIYAPARFATPSRERKEKTTTKRCHQASDNDKNKQKNQLKQWHLFLQKKH